MPNPDKSDQSSQAQQAPDDQPPPALSGFVDVQVLDALGLMTQSQYSYLTKKATSALALLPNTGQVRVCIVDDQRMSEAHAKFSGIAGTTDVLTFDLAPNTIEYESKVLDTDLTICFDEAKRQADVHLHPLEQELLLYIIHGTLHCLGYNDHDDDEYHRMHTKEDEILKAIGLAPTFFAKKSLTENNAPSQETGS